MKYFQTVPYRELGDFTRVNVTAFEILEQSLNARDEHHIKRGVNKGTYSFLIVEQLYEQLNHTWSEFQNMAGRLGQLYSSYDNLRKQAETAYDSIRNLTGGEAKLGSFTSQTVKVDTPLIYDNSDRRKLNLTTTLVSQDDTFEIMSVVNDFRRFSSAKIGSAINEEPGAFDRIDFPYVFEIATHPNDFFFIKNAALLQMQITYKPPFIGGLPTQIEFIMEFEDLSPLYESSFDRRPTVTINTRTGEAADVNFDEPIAGE